MPTPISQSDMEAIFAVTDDLGIHREALTVPLGKKDPGAVKRLAPNMIQVVLPEGVAPAEWCETTLREELAKLGYEALP